MNPSCWSDLHLSNSQLGPLFHRSIDPTGPNWAEMDPVTSLSMLGSDRNLDELCASSHPVMLCARTHATSCRPQEIVTEKPVPCLRG